MRVLIAGPSLLVAQAILFKVAAVMCDSWLSFASLLFMIYFIFLFSSNLRLGFSLLYDYLLLLTSSSWLL